MNTVQYCMYIIQLTVAKFTSVLTSRGGGEWVLDQHQLSDWRPGEINSLIDDDIIAQQKLIDDVSVICAANEYIHQIGNRLMFLLCCYATLCM